MYWWVGEDILAPFLCQLNRPACTWSHILIIIFRKNQTPDNIETISWLWICGSCRIMFRQIFTKVWKEIKIKLWKSALVWPPATVNAKSCKFNLLPNNQESIHQLYNSFCPQQIIPTIWSIFSFYIVGVMWKYFARIRTYIQLKLFVGYDKLIQSEMKSWTNSK